MAETWERLQASGVDGVALSMTVAGSGVPVLIVHGTSADGSRWLPLMRSLRDRYRVAALDRRGRGASGDAPGYTIELEGQDIVACAEALGGEVIVIAHSYGALCALEAAPRIAGLRGVLLYEPPLTAEPRPLPDLVPELDALLRDKQYDAVVEAFFARHVRVDPAVVLKMRQQPAWAARVEAAHTIPRELRAACNYGFRPELFKALKAPVELLEGSESPSIVRDAVALLANALPNSRVVTLSGQGHVAMDSAPEKFRDAIESFLVRTRVEREGRDPERPSVRQRLEGDGP